MKRISKGFLLLMGCLLVNSSWAVEFRDEWIYGEISLDPNSGKKIYTAGNTLSAGKLANIICNTSGDFFYHGNYIIDYQVINLQNDFIIIPEIVIRNKNNKVSFTGEKNRIITERNFGFFSIVGNLIPQHDQVDQLVNRNLSMPLMKVKTSCMKENDNHRNATELEITLILRGFMENYIITKTCTLASSKDQVISLRDANSRDLERGEVLGGSFNLNLNCPNNSQIQYTYAAFTDQSMPSNTSDILTLTNNSNAKGVGLKIYPAGDSQAIRFSPVQANALPYQANRLKNYQPGGGE